MEEKEKSRFGWWLAGFGAIGIILQYYRNHIFKQRVLNLEHEACSSLEDLGAIQGKIIYLNGTPAPHGSTSLIDEDFGYGMEDALLLNRKVEMYQWYKFGTKFLQRWSSYPILSLSNPPTFRNPPWIYHSQSFSFKGEMSLKNIVIGTKPILDALDHQDCYLTELTRRPELIGGNKVSGEEESIKESSKSIIFSTARNGYYKICYQYIPKNSRVSVLGIVYFKQITPYYNVFILSGDVPLKEMIRRIDTSTSSSVTSAFALSIILGIGFQMLYR